MPLQSAGKVLRLLSNLKEKYTTVDRHKCVHNCITQLTSSRRIMATSAGNIQLIQTRPIMSRIEFAR